MEPPVTRAPARLRSPYVFDARLNHGRGAYRDLRGRVAAWSSVRDWLDGYLARAEQAARALGDALRLRQVTLAEAELRMRDLAANAHLAAAVLERGGFAQMSPADYGRVGRLLYNPSAKDTPSERAQWGQYQHLRALFRDVASGKQRTDGRLALRLGAYVQSARGTYHRLEALDMERLGFDQARRVRHRLDSCQTHEGDGVRMGCVELAALGWVGVRDLVPIGGAVCWHSCHCTVRYMNSATGEEFEPERRAG